MNFSGIWQARGYGWFLEIRQDGYSIYDRTSISCVEFERGNRTQFSKAFTNITQTNTNELSLQVSGDITRYWFDRVAGLPGNVLLLKDPRNLDPLYNFEVFFKTFEQDYAFFERHGINWHACYQSLRKNISAETSEKELFTCFKTAVRQLQDNHVYLTSDEQTFNSDRIENIKQWMVNAFDLNSASLGDPTTIHTYGQFLNQSFVHNQATFAGNNLLCWGETAPGIGYLGVLRLFGFADTPEARSATGLPKPRYEVADFIRNDMDSLELILDEILDDISQFDALVLDIRVNGGGFDRAGMAIANRFADKKRLAFSKQVHTHSKRTPVQNFYVEPTGAQQFTKPIYLLTGQRTASAGEILTMCMIVLPHVTRVGQPTLGIFSDDLAKHLPNGWITSISNEIYTTADGQVFEARGIPAEVEAPVFQETDFCNGLHAAVDLAIKLAKN